MLLLQCVEQHYALCVVQSAPAELDNHRRWRLADEGAADEPNLIRPFSQGRQGAKYVAQLPHIAGQA